MFFKSPDALYKYCYRGHKCNVPHGHHGAAFNTENERLHVYVPEEMRKIMFAAVSSVFHRASCKSRSSIILDIPPA
eukprot:1830522-Amphidinium_carterae.1